MKPKTELYRGKNYGVFAGANGYYVAAMASDGISHYQPANQGNGWADSVRDECNADARELDGEAGAE